MFASLFRRRPSGSASRKAPKSRRPARLAFDCLEDRRLRTAVAVPRASSSSICWPTRLLAGHRPLPLTYDAETPTRALGAN